MMFNKTGLFGADLYVLFEKLMWVLLDILLARQISASFNNFDWDLSSVGLMQNCQNHYCFDTMVL